MVSRSHLPKIQFNGRTRPGDVIVFLFPREESLYYVKRVMGIPGDKVEFKGKDILINNQLIPKEVVSDLKVKEDITGSKDVPGDLYRENIDGHIHYVMYHESEVSDFLRSGQAEIVPPGMYFVMGDNRDDSYDSRRWGYVPRENIKGKAQVVWLSIDKNSGGGLEQIRWSRSFTLVR